MYSSGSRAKRIVILFDRQRSIASYALHFYPPSSFRLRDRHSKRRKTRIKLYAYSRRFDFTGRACDHERNSRTHAYTRGETRGSSLVSIANRKTGTILHAVITIIKLFPRWLPFRSRIVPRVRSVRGWASPGSFCAWSLYLCESVSEILSLISRIASLLTWITCIRVLYAFNVYVYSYWG